MQPGLHPEYGAVAFRDRSTGRVTVMGSTLFGHRSGATVTVDGVAYPVIDVDITSDSHPFWTGTTRTLDAEGRVEKFQRRYGRSA